MHTSVTAASLVVAAVLGVCACSPTDESPTNPGYGAEGPASAEELQACFANQPGDPKLTRSELNGIIYTDELGGQPASGLVSTALLQNGTVDGLPPAKAVKELTSTHGDAGAFEAYRSGTFLVYPNVRPYVIDPANYPELKAMLDVCLPVTESFA